MSRVRVYERYPGSPIHVEYTGAERKSLTDICGVRVYDKNLAMKIAQKISRKLERSSTGSLRHLLEVDRRHTLRQLLDAYHEEYEGGWSNKHKQIQRQLRNWWLEQLGDDARLESIRHRLAENLLKSHGKAFGWAPRTREKYLKYLEAAFRFGHKQGWVPSNNDIAMGGAPPQDA